LKEVMTSFDLAAATSELNEQVKDSRVTKIYQVGTHTLLIKLRRPDQPKLQLLIEAGKRIHLTSYKHETPQRPSSFCMSLRKHLDNGTLKQVKQHEFERIAILEIATRHGDYQLVTELFGAGNVILVDPEGKILQALTYKRMRDRNILRGETFRHPPSRGRNPRGLTPEEFMEIKQQGKTEIVRALTKFLSISGTYAEEVLLRAEINKKTKCEELTEEELNRIFTQIKNLLSTVDAGTLDPRIVSTENEEWIDVTPMPLRKYENFSQKPYKHFNNALDEYYAKIANLESREETTEEVESEVSRLKRILETQQKALEDLRQPIKENKTIGDLIYMHFGDLQALVQKIRELQQKGKTWKEIESTLKQGKQAGHSPELYFHSLEPKEQVLHVSIDDKVFPLSLRQPIQENANQYYLRSKKAEKKLRGAEEKIEETLAKIAEAEKQVAEAESTHRPMVKRRKREWFEKFRWFHSSDGFLVLGGRDATTNEILVKKHLEPHDIVLHAEILGAPFVIIKTEGRTVPEQTIKEAAQLAAAYSRAWKENLSTLNVYWVHPEQVSKTPPSGQFLKKGSFMIRGTKNFVRDVPLEAAIGIKTAANELRIIGGPVSAIAAQTNNYVEIVPGEHKSGQLAKKIRTRLAKKAPEDIKKTVAEIPLEEIQQFIPLGRGKIRQNS